MKAAFGKADDHGRWARCLNFIVEHEFEIRYLHVEKNFVVGYSSWRVGAARDSYSIINFWNNQFLASNKDSSVSTASLMLHEGVKDDNHTTVWRGTKRGETIFDQVGWRACTRKRTPALQFLWCSTAYWWDRRKLYVCRANVEVTR